MSDQPATLQRTGPFSTEKYTEQDALSVGLPSPEGLNLLVIFANQMIGTPFIPKALANGPNPAGNILAVVLTGREDGFGPMESLRSYWISPDGRLARYADSMMSKMRRHGFKFPIQEFTNERAVLKGVRPDGDEYQSVFTIEDAKRAGLTNKDIWQKYPSKMLKARVIGDVYRFLAADLGGPTYAAEEIQDLEPESSMAEPSDADQKRADVLAAQESEFKVGRRSSNPSDPATVAATIEKAYNAEFGTAADLRASDVDAEKIPYPTGSVLYTEPEPKPPEPPKPAPIPRYGIFRVEADRMVLLDAEGVFRGNNQAASLRAQALVNQHHQEFAVKDLDTGEEWRFSPPEPPKQVLEVGTGPWVKAEMERLKIVLGGGKTAASKINSFLRGYWGATDLLKDPQAYVNPLASLETILGSPGGKDRVLADPSVAGAKSAGRLNHPVDDMGWSPEVAEAAKLAFAAIGFKTKNELVAYVNACNLKGLDDEDLRSFFRIAARVRDAHKLIELVATYQDQGISYASVVGYLEKETGKAVEAIHGAVIQEAIEATLISLKQQTAPPAEPDDPQEELPFN